MNHSLKSLAGAFELSNSCDETPKTGIISSSWSLKGDYHLLSQHTDF